MSYPNDVPDDPKPQGPELEPFLSCRALADYLNAGLASATETESSIRNLIGDRYKSGLDEFCIKTGRKVLISGPGYQWWRRRVGNSTSTRKRQERVRVSV